MSDHQYHAIGGHMACDAYEICQCRCTVCREASKERLGAQIRALREEATIREAELQKLDVPPDVARQEDIRQIYNNVWSLVPGDQCHWWPPATREVITAMQALHSEAERLAYLDAHPLWKK